MEIRGVPKKDCWEWWKITCSGTTGALSEHDQRIREGDRLGAKAKLTRHLLEEL